MIKKRVDLSDGLIKCEYLIGDICDTLQEFNDDTFDMMYADPPYNVGKDILGDEPKTIRLYMDFTIEWLYHAVRKVKRGGHIYISFAQIFAPYLYMAVKEPSMFFNYWNTLNSGYISYLNYNLQFRNWMIMRYTNVKKPFSMGGCNYNYDYEPVLYFSKGLKKQKVRPLNIHHCDDVFNCTRNCKMPTHQVKEHPTEKPMELYRDIILHSSAQGELLLDCFTGSGNFLLMSRALKRRSIGIDADTKYLGHFRSGKTDAKIRKFLVGGQVRFL